MTVEQRGYCCEQKGVGCMKGYLRWQRRLDWKRAVEEAPLFHRAFTLKLGNLVYTLLDNPKYVLARLRWLLLAASPRLQQQPHTLVVDVLGILMVNSTLPPQHLRNKWTIPIPRNWNDEILDQEKSRVASSGREGVTLGSHDGSDDEGVFIEATVHATTEQAAIDTVAEVSSAFALPGDVLVGGGVAEARVLEPIALTPIASTPSSKDSVPIKNDSSTSSHAWLWALIGGFAALCVGGSVFAAVIFRRSRDYKEDDDDDDEDGDYWVELMR